MKTLMFAPMLATALFIAQTGAFANGPSDKKSEPCDTKAKLEYKFYKNNAHNNYYNLAYSNQTSETVKVKVLDANGKVMSRDTYRDKVLTTNVNLNDYKPGIYTIEIQAGNCNVIQETVTVQ